MRNLYRILVGNPISRDHAGDLLCRWRMLKFIWKKQNVKAWIGLNRPSGKIIYCKNAFVFMALYHYIWRIKFKSLYMYVQSQCVLWKVRVITSNSLICHVCLLVFFWALCLRFTNFAIFRIYVIHCWLFQYCNCVASNPAVIQPSRVLRDNMFVNGMWWFTSSWKAEG